YIAGFMTAAETYYENTKIHGLDLDDSNTLNENVNNRKRNITKYFEKDNILSTYPEITSILEENETFSTSHNIKIPNNKAGRISKLKKLQNTQHSLTSEMSYVSHLSKISKSSPQGENVLPLGTKETQHLLNLSIEPQISISTLNKE